jgi:PAS domain S-box-containing protein
METLKEKTDTLFLKDEHLVRILENCHDALFKVSRGVEILYHKARNSSFQQSAYFEGKNLSALFPEELVDTLQATIGRAEHTEEMETLECSFLLSAKIHHFEIQVLPLADEKTVLLFRDITEKKKLQQAKKQSDENFSILFHYAGHAMSLLDKEGIVLDVNEVVTEATGVSKAELCGRSVWEVFDLDETGAFRQKLKKAVRIASSGEQVRYVEELTLPRGPVWLDISVKPILNEDAEVHRLICEGWDITDRKQMEARLIESEKMYRSIALNIPNGAVVTFDNDMRFRMAEGHEIGKVYSETDLKGKTPSQIYSTALGLQLTTEYGKVLKGETVSFEMQGDFSRKYYSVTATPILDAKGKIDGGMAVLFDITHLKKVEQELGEKVSALEKSISRLKATETELNDKLSEVSSLNEKMNQEINIRSFIETNLKQYTSELKAKNQELEQFAYVASHDLQEPLRMVASYTQLLAKKYKNQLDADANIFIEFATEGAQRMQNLINDLLAYSKVDNAPRKLSRTDMEEVVNIVRSNLSIKIEETATVMESRNMPVISGYQLQLVPLIQKLAINAIKFVDKSKTPIIRVAAEDQSDKWLFSVTDNGIGINPEHRQRIFQIFQRLHTRDKYPGTGIGLAICKKIVERHNGEIWVESVPGEGSTFFFTISKEISPESQEAGI